MIYAMRFISDRSPPPFGIHHSAENIIREIERFQLEGRISLYAYCLMPDHLHIVAAPPAGSSIGKLIQDFKIATCMAGFDNGIHGSIWDNVSYLPIGDDAGAVKDICSFVVSNPIRNGLADNGRPWPYAWMRRESGADLK